MPAGETPAETYCSDADVLAALAKPGQIGKSAISPAMTTVAGWAAELSTPAILDTLQMLATQSVYAKLSSRPGATRVDITGRSSVKVPTKAPSPTLSAPFVAEGAPIAVRQLALSWPRSRRKRPP
jgi:hypothetical protein